MRFVFLYGPPGVGKLTVARELAALTGFRLFHNHLTVNLVTAIFPPNTAAWNRLARQIRTEVFTAAAREGADLILTRAPRNAAPDEIERVQAMIAPVLEASGEVCFVRLTCDRDELLRRVRREDRRAQSKLTDPQVLLDLFDLDVALPFSPQITIDVTHSQPMDAAAQIAAHFAMPLRPAAGGEDRPPPHPDGR